MNDAHDNAIHPNAAFLRPFRIKPAFLEEKPFIFVVGLGSFCEYIPYQMIEVTDGNRQTRKKSPRFETSPVFPTRRTPDS
jgi:hypothetical protein